MSDGPFSTYLRPRVSSAAAQGIDVATCFDRRGGRRDSERIDVQTRLVTGRTEGIEAAPCLIGRRSERVDAAACLSPEAGDEAPQALQ